MNESQERLVFPIFDQFSFCEVTLASFLFISCQFNHIKFKLTNSNSVTGIPAHTAVPKDLEYSELAQNTGARYYMGELGSLVTPKVEKLREVRKERLFVSFQ